ncbi:ROK family protein [Candidatus Woesearchaeota archaeon]|nr:ROK family protein [Candidatus Woesearchaeota archaeon]
MIIGVDIGGTEIKAGSVSNNKIINKKTVRTGKDAVDNLIRCISEVFDKKVKGIGIGAPGPADYEKGIIGKTPNLDFKNKNIRKIISNKFKKRVIMQNDASCFVLGESIRLKKKNVVGMTLGTGVGGGIVIEGKLYVGNGNAGELGHCTIKYDGPKDGLSKGSIESYASGKAIKREYGKDAHNLKSKKAWNEIGKKIGIRISNLINTFDPDAVVLGGGISKAFSKFKKGMNQEIKKRAIRKVNVVKGSEDSGMIGAANLFSNI